MYCTNCGKKIVDGSKFCAFCGQVITPQDKEVNENAMGLMEPEKAPVSKENIVVKEKDNKTTKKKKTSLYNIIYDIFTFEGRMSNGAFWGRMIILIVLEIIYVLYVPEKFLTSVIGIIIWAFFFILPFTYGCRRMHDTGRSGAYILLLLVPIANIVALVWLIQDGQPYTNRFGPDPKGRNMEQFFPY